MQGLIFFKKDRNKSLIRDLLTFRDSNIRDFVVQSILIVFSCTVESLKWVEAITGQKQGNHTIHTVFFITVRAIMTLLTYCNEENHINRVVSLLLARTSFDPF